MTDKECCVIDAMAGRVCVEVSLAVEKRGNTSKALEHLETAQKALEALRYKIFQTSHVSGTRG